MVCNPLIVEDFEDCPRCGGTHDRVEFREMARPVEFDEYDSLTHSAPCPATGEPILLGVVGSEKDHA